MQPIMKWSGGRRIFLSSLGQTFIVAMDDDIEWQSWTFQSEQEARAWYDLFRTD